MFFGLVIVLGVFTSGSVALIVNLIGTVPWYPLFPVAVAVVSVIALRVYLPTAAGNLLSIADVIVAFSLSAISPILPSVMIVDNWGSGAGVVSITFTSILTSSALSAEIVIFVVPTFKPVIVNVSLPLTDAMASPTALTLVKSEKLVILTVSVFVPFKSRSLVDVLSTLITFFQHLLW